MRFIILILPLADKMTQILKLVYKTENESPTSTIIPRFETDHPSRRQLL